MTYEDDFRFFVLKQLVINDWPHQEVEFSTSHKKLTIKRRVLREVAPKGYRFVIFHCETCKSYDPSCPYHVQLQSEEEYEQSGGRDL